ncbi:MAG: hypothetical protein CMP11_09075 [Zetaproteobacteria bacterium]|nr:hypothetical protein [Pseudobdellovibrionaceae bacterium]
MSYSQQIGSECVQSLVKRKDLEAFIGLLSSRKNKIRKAFIENKKLENKELKNLLSVSQIKKSEYLLLKTLFSKISWKTEIVNLNETSIFPGTFTLSNETDLSRSTVFQARKTLKAKGLIRWKNQYEDSQRSSGLESQNNIYFFTPKLIALAQFTELGQKNLHGEQEKKSLASLIDILKQDLVEEKTAHQKSGLQGALTRQKNTANLEELKTILAELRATQTHEQKSLVSKLERVVSEMDEAKEKNKFEISDESKITKRSSKVITLKNRTRGVQKLDGGVRESDP